MTYAEALTVMADDSPLLPKVRVAVLVSADVVRAEVATTANHVARLAWAKSVYKDPDGWARIMLKAAVAQNLVSTTQAAALSATDAQIQNACNAAIDVLT